MARTKFIDPAGSRTTYEWAISFNTEEQHGKTRQIERTAPTAGVGFVRQQGEDSPLIIKVAGTILAKAQLTEMIAWYKLCSSQTIYFRDFEENEWEVIITSFQPVRQRNIGNPRDPVNAPYWHWTYSIEMEVINERSGEDWE